MYFYGNLLEDIPRIPKKKRVFALGWFSRENLPASKNKDLLDWISDDMPTMCYHHEDL
jgi:hypothetical protein